MAIHYFTCSWLTTSVDLWFSQHLTACWLQSPFATKGLSKKDLNQRPHEYKNSAKWKQITHRVWNEKQRYHLSLGTYMFIQVQISLFYVYLHLWYICWFLYCYILKTILPCLKNILIACSKKKLISKSLWYTFTLKKCKISAVCNDIWNKLQYGIDFKFLFLLYEFVYQLSGAEINVSLWFSTMV